MRSRKAGICNMPLFDRMTGRSRPHLSLREGSEQPPRSGAESPASPIPSTAPPFPLALDDSGSVLAVKGSLRRFAPWTAPGRSERRAAYEGKGGGGPWGAERGGSKSRGPLVHDKGYYHSCTEGADAPKGTFRPYQPSEPQPRGAVTRRAVAQRRSRASGLTRPSAEAIRGGLVAASACPTHRGL